MRSLMFLAFVHPSWQLDPAVPFWLPNKGFRTKDETRSILEYVWEGTHSCNSASDQFPSTTCLDKNNMNYKLDQYRPPRKCMECSGADLSRRNQITTNVWTATFCSEKPEADDTMWTQYVEYTDAECQHVNSWDFSNDTDNLLLHPASCGGYKDCAAECMGPQPNRLSRGCAHRHGMDKAACLQESLCHWNEPPMNISFAPSYYVIGNYSHPDKYVCHDNQCVYDESGIALSVCEQVCKSSLVV